MAEPIKAKDVIIQFLSGDSYITYGCAAELETQFTMETKEVKTVGDGVWKRKRGQSLSQVVTLSGVIAPDEDIPDVFDLLEYFKNMVDVDFKILFYDSTGLRKVLQGRGLPVDVTMSAGSEGFATGSITIECNGDPDAVPDPDPDPDDPDVCISEIEAAHTEIIGPPNRRYVFIDSLVSGSATISRYDWSYDGGGTQSEFTDGTLPTSWILPLSANVGDHTVLITPICENGVAGTPFTLDIP